MARLRLRRSTSSRQLRTCRRRVRQGYTPQARQLPATLLPRNDCARFARRTRSALFEVAAAGGQ
eukprot:2892835-Pleurochrysis_carterae.AAC.1